MTGPWLFRCTWAAALAFSIAMSPPAAGGEPVALSLQAGIPKEVLYYGKEGALAVQIPLRAGPLAMVYEAGDLRYIKLGDREVVRRWYAVTRNRNWGTLENRLSHVTMDIKPDSFHIRYDVENTEKEIDFVWTGDITGERNGTITFVFDGVARSTFLRNRIGFCILHPSRECPGARCRAVYADGRVAESTFPRYIAPDNPFQELKGFAHEVLPGLWAELDFEGDLFEMEDQRNWVDASFKTFCTPLRVPFPVEVKQGTRVSQRVTLRLQGTAPDAAAAPAQKELTFDLLPDEAPTGAAQKNVNERGSPASRAETRRRLPSIGLGVSSDGRPLTTRQLQRLRAMRPAHLRVDLSLSRPEHADTLRQATRDATALGVRLETAVHVSNDAEQELKKLAKLLGEVRPPVTRWLVFHVSEQSTTEPWIKMARQFLGNYDPMAALVSGTNAYFTQLNRGRPPVHAIDGICYSINPQVHAFDNRSLVETLEAHTSTIESAQQFIGSKPLVITPVTLQPRFNPAATAVESPPGPGELPAQVDVRQMSLFGAGWTLGSLKYIAESARVQSVTYYETVGWRGVMEADEGSPVPERFRSIPGSVFPLYHVLADVGEMAAGVALPARSSDTLRLDGLVVEHEGRQRWIIANLTADSQTVQVRGVQGTARAKRLNESNVVRAMVNPEEFRAEHAEPLDVAAGRLTLHLLPYEICRIDVMRQGK
jgi:hypothetical protein